MLKKRKKLFGADVELLIDEEGKIKEIYFLSKKHHEEEQKRSEKNSG